MGYNRNKNADILRSLNKDKVIYLMEKHSIKEIAEMYSLSESTAGRIINQLIYDHGIVSYTKETQYKPWNEPFSKNEDDYGFQPKKKVFITKFGIIKFDGNSDLTPIKTKITRVSDIYKNMCTHYGVLLNSIPQHKHKKYGQRD